MSAPPLSAQVAVIEEAIADLEKARDLDRELIAKLDAQHARLRGLLITASNSHALVLDACSRQDQLQLEHQLAVLASAIGQARDLLGAPKRGGALRAIDVAGGAA